MGRYSVSDFNKTFIISAWNSFVERMGNEITKRRKIIYVEDMARFLVLDTKAVIDALGDLYE